MKLVALAILVAAGVSLTDAGFAQTNFPITEFGVSQVRQIRRALPAETSPSLPGEELRGRALTMLKELIPVAVREPSTFGFQSPEEAANAAIGACYPLYTLDEWKYLGEKTQEAKSKGEPPPAAPISRILCEVVNISGKPVCGLVAAVQKDTGRWAPALLGMKNWAPEFEKLRGLPSDWGVVIVGDTETGQFSVAQADKPGQIEDYSKSDSKSEP